MENTKKQMQTLIEKIEQKPVHYLGKRYYYSISTNLLYLRTNGRLLPVLEKGLNIAVMYQPTTKQQEG